MADIAWSAYALAMFTPEERAAAVAAIPETGTIVNPPPLPPVAGPPAVVATGLGYRITGPGIPVAGYDPNKPAELAEIMRLGWRFEGGRWIAPASPGVAASPDQVLAGGRPPGLSSVLTVSTIAGGSVLGYSVPLAPAVALPQWVGGRIGHVVQSGGTRPESGGTPRIIRGEGHKYPWTRVVR